MSEFSDLLQARFNVENQALIKKFNIAKQEASSHGMLHSSRTVLLMHQACAEELANSTKIIVKSAFESHSLNGSYPKKDNIEKDCTEALHKRADEIDVIFNTHASATVNALSNNAMLEPHLSVNNEISVNIAELRVSVQKEHDEYINKRGGTLTGFVKKRFLNNSIIAWAVVVFAVIGVIATFITSINLINTVISGNG